MSSKAQAAMHLWKELEESKDVKLVRCVLVSSAVSMASNTL